MGKKKFLAFLGTGGYKEMQYTLDGRRSKPTIFVQEAIIEHLSANGSAPENFYIFLTTEARKKHWESDNNLRERLESFGTTHEIDIPSKGSKEDLWIIFQKMLSVLDEGDEV